MAFAYEKKIPSREVDVGPSVAAQSPILQKHANHMEKTLSACLESIHRLENAVDRLIGSEPKGEGSLQETAATANSYERRLIEILSMAEILSSRLTHAANRLDSAV